MRALSILLALAALCCCASAARFPADPLMMNIPNVPFHPQTWLDSLNRRSDEPAYVVCYYMVEPEQREDFINAWLDLEGKAKDEKGLRFFDLKHPETNNVMFVAYAEWKTIQHFMDFHESGYAQDYLQRINKMDVTFTTFFLERPDVAELNPGKKMQTKNELAHAMIHYHVPPSAQEDFLDAWNRVEKEVEGEKGAHTYSLRKFKGTNHHYFAYGTWETHEDFYTHFDSDYVQDLKEALNKNGVEWYMAPLVKLGSQRE